MPLRSWISNIFFFGGRKIFSIFDLKVLTDVIFLSEGSKLLQILMALGKKTISIVVSLSIGKGNEVFTTCGDSISTGRRY